MVTRNGNIIIFASAQRIHLEPSHSVEPRNDVCNVFDNINMTEQEITSRRLLSSAAILNDINYRRANAVIRSFHQSVSLIIKIITQQIRAYMERCTLIGIIQTTESTEYLSKVYHVLVEESLIVSDKVCKFMTSLAVQCLVVVDSRWRDWKY